jgi:hypothetical protein
MVLTTNTEKLLSVEARGKFGRSAGCGMARCGYSRCGSSKLFGGIYKRKKTRTGWGISRERYYQPTNPQTIPQQTWRSVFAAGWDAYNLLTPDEKVLLSKEARKYRMTGANLFMRRFLQANR